MHEFHFFNEIPKKYFLLWVVSIDLILSCLGKFQHKQATKRVKQTISNGSVENKTRKKFRKTKRKKTWTFDLHIKLETGLNQNGPLLAVGIGWFSDGILDRAVLCCVK